MPRFHERTLALLGSEEIRPQRPVEVLLDWATQNAIRLPAAFVEWAKLDDGSLLRKYSNRVRFWFDKPKLVVTTDGVRGLLFNQQDQGNFDRIVCLDQGDDPPVLFAWIARAPWVKNTERFSDAVFAQVFDWQYWLEFKPDDPDYREITHTGDISLKTGNCLALLRKRYEVRLMLADAMPLFVCHANCARSVLAAYLYRHLCAEAPAASAGLAVGAEISDRVLGMLGRWGIDASGHRPRQLDRELCDRAVAIFVMGPPYLARLLRDYGQDLAGKAYLFADPFTRPVSFARGEFMVYDPSFDHRSVRDLVHEFGWMRERVLQIGLALLGEGRPLVSAREYSALLCGVDPSGH
jgi:hypothetical protein